MTIKKDPIFEIYKAALYSVMIKIVIFDIKHWILGMSGNRKAPAELKHF